jgi:hypothetical protein
MPSYIRERLRSLTPVNNWHERLTGRGRVRACSGCDRGAIDVWMPAVLAASHPPITYHLSHAVASSTPPQASGDLQERAALCSQRVTTLERAREAVVCKRKNARRAAYNPDSCQQSLISRVPEVKYLVPR